MCIRDRLWLRPQTKTFVSISVLSPLKMATDGVAEMFANNNIGPRPDSSENVTNYDAGCESLRQQNFTLSSFT